MLLLAPDASWAYPFWAQQNYENPREATGKIVCANCHLAKMTTQAEVPQSVGAASVFKAVVKKMVYNNLYIIIAMAFFFYKLGFYDIGPVSHY